MNSLAMSLILQASMLGATEKSYADAYKSQEETGRPLVVLVGAEWCPGCRTMKQSVLPEVERHGALERVHFAVVNTDQDRDLAGKLMEGGSIPQLVMYRKTSKGWIRRRLTGSRSAADVEAFLKEGAEANAAELTSARNG